MCKNVDVRNDGSVSSELHTIKDSIEFDLVSALSDGQLPVNYTT